MDLKIKIGHNFKFIVKRGKDLSYVVSNRYNLISDGFGHVNNIYDPKKINWLTEKKKTKFVSPYRRSSIKHTHTEDFNSITETNSESYNDEFTHSQFL